MTNPYKCNINGKMNYEKDGNGADTRVMTIVMPHGFNKALNQLDGMKQMNVAFRHHEKQTGELLTTNVTEHMRAKH